MNDSNTETGRDYVADSRKLTVGSSEYLTDNYHQKLITDILKEMDSMQTLSQPGLAELTRVDKQSFTFTAWHGRRTHNHSTIQTFKLPRCFGRELAPWASRPSFGRVKGAWDAPGYVVRKPLGLFGATNSLSYAQRPLTKYCARCVQQGRAPLW